MNSTVHIKMGVRWLLVFYAIASNAAFGAIKVTFLGCDNQKAFHFLVENNSEVKAGWLAPTIGHYNPDYYRICSARASCDVAPCEIDKPVVSPHSIIDGSREVKAGWSVSTSTNSQSPSYNIGGASVSHDLVPCAMDKPTQSCNYLKAFEQQVSLKQSDARLYKALDRCVWNKPLSQSDIDYCNTVSMPTWQKMVSALSEVEAAHCYTLHRFAPYREIMQKASVHNSDLNRELMNIRNRILSDAAYKKSLDALGHSITDSLLALGNNAVAIAGAHQREVSPFECSRIEKEFVQVKQNQIEQQAYYASVADSQNRTQYQQDNFALQLQKNKQLDSVMGQLEELPEKPHSPAIQYINYTDGFKELTHKDLSALTQLGVTEDDFYCIGNGKQHILHRKFIFPFKAIAGLIGSEALTASHCIDATPLFKHAIAEARAGIACNRNADVAGAFNHLNNYYEMFNSLGVIKRDAVKYKESFDSQKLNVIKHDVIHQLRAFNRPYAGKMIMDDRTSCLQQRELALTKIIGGDYSIDLKKYGVLSQSKQTLEQAQIPLHLFEQCIGNAVQQTVHEQTIDLLNRASTKQQLPDAEKVLIAHLAHAADNAVQSGRIDTALTCIDMGNAWLSTKLQPIAPMTYAQGVLKGALAGIENVGKSIHHIVTKPQEIAYAGVLAVLHVADILDYSSYDASTPLHTPYDEKLVQVYEQKAVECAALCTTIGNSLSTLSAMNGPEWAECAATQAAEMVAWGGVSKVVGATLKLIPVAIKAIPKIAQTETVTGAYQKLAVAAESVEMALARSRVRLLGEQAEAVIADMQLKVPAAALMEAEQVGAGTVKAGVKAAEVGAQPEKVAGAVKDMIKGTEKLKDASIRPLPKISGGDKQVVKSIKLSMQEIVTKYTDQVKKVTEQFGDRFKEIKLSLPDAEFFHHVYDRHYPGGSSLIDKKGIARSVFNAEEDVIKIVADGWESGRFIELDLRYMMLEESLEKQEMENLHPWLKL